MANARMFLVNTATGLAVCIGTYGVSMTGWTANGDEEWNPLRALFSAVEAKLGVDNYYPSGCYVLVPEGILGYAQRLEEERRMWMVSVQGLRTIEEWGYKAV